MHLVTALPQMIGRSHAVRREPTRTEAAKLSVLLFSTAGAWTERGRLYLKGQLKLGLHCLWH